MRVVFAVVVLASALTLGAATAALGQSFTDDPLTVGTAVKAVHVSELRTEVANLRAIFALPVVPFTDPTLTPSVTSIRAIHLAELRTALDAVYDAAGKPHPIYTDPVLTGVAIKAVHIQQLRTAVINAINDAPSFTKGANQSVTEDAGAQTVVGWATAISAGPGETGQTVTFVIDTNTTPGLFAAGPSVASNGTLTYTPAANQNGVATITLHAHDDGGTAGGGVDNSPTQSFTITVNAVNDAPVVTNKTYGPNGVQANMKIVGLTGLLNGVTDADAGVNGCSPTFTVTNVSATTPAGGVVTVTASTGVFDFEPPPGASGNVTFTYTVQDTGCPGTATSAPATVTVNVAGPVIWFVNAAVVGPGDGRLSNPFKTLASADAVDNVNHRIFLYIGTYGTGIALNSGESLIGQGVSTVSDPSFTSFDALFGITPPAGTIARPTIAGTRPTVQSTVTLNTGSAVRGLNLSTGAAAGLNDPAGAITGAAASEVNVTTTTGIAVNLSDLGGTITLTSVAANGAANGISLTNTTGSFTVTGTTAGFCGGQVSGTPLSITTAPVTADCTGGRIQSTSGGDGTTSGIGIYLSSVQNVSLTRMQLDNHPNFAIRGTTVNGFTLSNALIDGVNGSTTSPDEGSISFTNLLGTAAITNSTVRGGFEDNIQIINSTGTGTVTISGSTVRDNSTSNGNDGVFGQANPGATLTLKVINSVLQRHRGDHVNTTQSGNGVIHTVVTGNTMTFNGTIGQPFDIATTAGGSVTLTTGANFTGTSTFNVSNNNISGAKTSPVNINNTALTSTVSGVFSGTISGNTIGTAGSVGSGSDGDGIDVTANGNANITVTITGNSVRQWKLLGINLVPRDGAATMNATVQGNTVTEPFDLVSSGQAILFNGGPATTETGNSCVNVGGSLGGQPNSLPGPYAAGILPIRVRQRAVNTITLPGYAGGNIDTTAVNLYLSLRNGGAGATSTVNVPPGGGFVGGAACPAGATP